MNVPVEEGWISVNETLSFENPQGRSSEVTILKKREIFEGGAGKIYLAKVLIGDKERLFVLKDYKINKLAEDAFKNYTHAKEVGLKVFPTFRINKDQGIILMTTRNTDDLICVSSNGPGDSKLEDFGESKIEEIENIEELVESLIQQSFAAGEAGLIVDSDSVFFTVNRKNKEVVDFEFGDLEALHKVTVSGIKIISMNLRNTREALLSFVKNNVENLGGFKHTQSVRRKFDSRFP